MAKGNPSKQTSKSVKKTKQCGKKHMNACHIYCSEQQAQRPDLNTMSTKEQIKLLKAEWKQLSAQQKQAFQMKAINQISQSTITKKGSTSNKVQSFAKATSGIKRNPRRKTPSKKKTPAKKTKRIDRQSATRKETPEKVDQKEIDETVENIQE